MEKQIDDGGPAYPCETYAVNPLGVSYPVQGEGMSLRDWFAGQALTVIDPSHVKEYELASMFGPNRTGIKREEPRRRARLGVLGEKILETVEPTTPSFFDPQPRPVLTLQPKKEAEPMSNVTPIKTATPEPVAEKSKDPGYTKLSQSEVVQVTKLLLVNGTVDDETKTFTFGEGWSDERILAILQAMPGREQIKLSHVSALRKKDFGETPEEKSRRNPPPPADAASLAPRLSSVEARLERLERELGLKS